MKKLVRRAHRAGDDQVYHVTTQPTGFCFSGFHTACMCVFGSLTSGKWWLRRSHVWCPASILVCCDIVWACVYLAQYISHLYFRSGGLTSQVGANIGLYRAVSDTPCVCVVKVTGVAGVAQLVEADDIRLASQQLRWVCFTTWMKLRSFSTTLEFVRGQRIHSQSLGLFFITDRKY